MKQSNVILASTIFEDGKSQNKWVDRNGSITVPNGKMAVRKNATSAIENFYHENYY